MRLSRIWRILQVEESVIHRGRRPRWITPSEFCRILHILRKPNSIIALLFIQNIIFAKTCKLYSRPFLCLLNDTALCPGFLGKWFNNLWRQWFNNLQRAALLTSFWRQWFNNLQRTALLTSLVQYARILGQQQLFMVNYARGFNQSETGKYFEWIIMWISHRKEIRKLTFRALALRRSESRSMLLSNGSHYSESVSDCLPGSSSHFTI